MSRFFRAALIAALFLCRPAASGDAGFGEAGPGSPLAPLAPLPADGVPAARGAQTPPSARVTVAIPAPAALYSPPPPPKQEKHREAPEDLKTEEPPPAPETERVLAVLDGEKITERDVFRELWRFRGRETLDWMVGRAVIRRELDGKGLSVSDAEVKEKLDEYLAGFAAAFPGAKDPDALVRSAAGMPLEEYRERAVWPEVALRKLMRIDLAPSEETLRAYYAEQKALFIEPERIRIRQIFVSPAVLAEPGDGGLKTAGPGEWEAAKKRVEEAHARLRSGADFEDTERSYGAGGPHGGAVWAERGELLRELEDLAFGLRPEAVSAPLRTAMGYHIIKMIEKRERREPSFEEARERVLASYEERAFALLAGDYLEKLREKAVASGMLSLHGAGDADGPSGSE